MRRSEEVAAVGWCRLVLCDDSHVVLMRVDVCAGLSFVQRVKQDASSSDDGDVRKLAWVAAMGGGGYSEVAESLA